MISGEAGRYVTDGIREKARHAISLAATSRGYRLYEERGPLADAVVEAVAGDIAAAVRAECAAGVRTFHRPIRSSHEDKLVCNVCRDRTWPCLVEGLVRDWEATP